MKLILVQSDQTFSHAGNHQNDMTGISVSFRNVTTTVSPIFTEEDQPIESLLKSLLISKVKGENAKFWNIKINVGLTDTPVIPDLYRSVVTVKDCRPGGILETINDFFGGHLKLRVDFLNAAAPAHRGQYGSINFNTDEMSLSQSSGSNGAIRTKEDNIVIYQRQTMCNLWKQNQHMFTGIIVVTAIIPDTVVLTEDPTIRDKMNINRKILQEEIGWDVWIIPGSGDAIKCHKSFLCAHSSVFRSMFQRDTKESQTYV